MTETMTLGLPGEREVDGDRTISASMTGLGKTFVSKGRSVDALSDVDLEIEQGEYVVVLGPSGCGKSTLLRCVAGLEAPTTGRIQLAGKTVFSVQPQIDIRPNDRKVGMVFQNYALWPHLNVERNVAYPLRMRKVAKEDRRTKVTAVLEAVECLHLAKRLPAELSGGQQQRVALARALVYEPSLLLLDEPLSNLDALLRISLRSELLRLHRELGFTAVHITHDQEEALEMGDRVVLMREGRIEQVGTPEEVYSRPVSPYAADFLGVRNRLDVTVRGGEFVSALGLRMGGQQIASHHPEGTTLRLFVRSNSVRVGTLQDPSGSHISVAGTLVQTTLSEGGRRKYVLDVDGATWFAFREGPVSFQPGERVELSVEVRDALIYLDGKLWTMPST
ncbi:iron(III) transport system ATP-binding protein [Kribbella sp. VKM Ac-2527]|uniref:Iron(III) transport system ATP-binding protein n=1 Tax=Kribbella caucasensis TaxID=2512215 RepID=A0A4R6KPP3_9ACTN|nr:ABC transporter ATP-binding protein [Kribbella sp. VKM Ac-2527]TDO51569.1 iron(III) transport system ATP-binding protein [Kribbella sp. VKM Ac-2527]